MTKGLEALDTIRNLQIEFNKNTNFRKGTIIDNLVPEELIVPIEKELKALEIIKEKRVDIEIEILLIITYREYKKYFENKDFSELYLLTKEEFYLLKEVLCNDKREKNNKNSDN